MKKHKQCLSKNVFSQLRCQGASKHKSHHWCYGFDGWLHQWKSKKDIKNKFDWASSHTPPDHKGYIHPKDKINEHYRVKK